MFQKGTSPICYLLFAVEAIENVSMIDTRLPKGARPATGNRHQAHGCQQIAVSISVAA
jgi:hypothetical protein